MLQLLRVEERRVLLVRGAQHALSKRARLRACAFLQRHHCWVDPQRGVISAEESVGSTAVAAIRRVLDDERHAGVVRRAKQLAEPFDYLICLPQLVGVACRRRRQPLRTGASPHRRRPAVAPA